ncbi:MAG: ATP-dependent RNA helicase HrpA [Dermatophilaceae bacterium]
MATRADRHRRRASVPPLRYPEHLPVVARRGDIAAAIRDHQVVVVAGETGSGKTTQIPKICLEIGRGIAGTIGHTQPRRIAARSVAERIADELDVELGSVVGYQVRFADHASRDSLVKVMTDGILLAELQHDRDLRRYDTIIIDEAHERSLNIDFMLGYLKALLPRRPDLKVVVTSATIDPHRFARHFADADGMPAPVIEVSGRTYPVQVRYRPLVREDPKGRLAEIDQVSGICEAVEELWTEGSPGGGTTGWADGHDGQAEHDILVFLSGEREIRDAAEALEGMGLPDTEVVALFARLSAAEQHRVFARHAGRRVVLATNVAETSLTVPGIRYVVDTGTARISRYSQRTKVQRLPIEAISRASARQRAGRCGRLSDGVCIRLYSEQDYEQRPAFTEPEILRTNLASVILQMTALGLGDVAAFPFVDPPDRRRIADGVALLEELQAMTEGALTAYGRTMARLPLDPRLGRMVLEANRLGCLREVLVVVAALSIQDPRERPAEHHEQAAAAHRRFADPTSDFVAYLNLWNYLRAQQDERSGSAFRRMCRAEFLHYLRVREWQDLVTQLRQACRQGGFDVRRGARHAASSAQAREHATSAQAREHALSAQAREHALSAQAREHAPSTSLHDALHQALLSGLLSHVGARDELRRDYLGARGVRFAVAPGSVLFRRSPEFVMAAELVETSRLWARTAARVEPGWAERLGAHLVARQYSEPRWSARRGSAVATERVTLYGVPLVAGRTVAMGTVDPTLARELFIRHALVEGDWGTRHRFWHDNAALLARLHELEARGRRRDVVVGDEALVRFYDERLPPSVVSARHFDAWWKRAERRDPTLLDFTEALLLRPDASPAAGADFPEVWVQGAMRLPLSYRFEPGSAGDGVTVHVGTDQLSALRPDGFDWQVPGLREDLVAALLRSLPTSLRRLLVPAPEHAAATMRVLQQRGLGPGDGPLTDVLSMVLRQTHGVVIGAPDWHLERVPDHLRVTFCVEDRDGTVVASGKSLPALRERAAPQVRREVAQAGAALEHTGLRGWPPLDQVPQEYVGTAGGRQVRGYPALVDDGGSVALRVLPTRAEAEAEHRLGVRRLLLLGTPPPWRAVLAGLSNSDKLALAHNPHGSVPELLDDALACAVDAIVLERAEHVPRSRAEFESALDAVRRHAAARVGRVVRLVEPVLALHLQVLGRLDAMNAPRLADLVADVRAQLAELVRPGFVADTGLARLPDLQRYLRAVLLRLDKAPSDLTRDRARLDEVLAVETAYAGLLDSLRPTERGRADVLGVGWMIEELRVSLFAQALGTAYPVSAKRVMRAIQGMRDQAGSLDQ